MAKKLANFDNPKWSYNDLKGYARKYRAMLDERENVSIDILSKLKMYQSIHKDLLISNLKVVQNYLYN